MMNNICKEVLYSYKNIPINRHITPFLSVLEGFYRQAIKEPDNIFIIEENIERLGSEAVITYIDALNKSLALAEYIEKAYKIEVGQVVGIMPKNDIQSVLIILAVMMTGATVVCLNQGDPAERIQQQLDGLSCKILINCNNTHLSLQHIQVVNPTLSALSNQLDFEKMRIERRLQWLDYNENTIALVLYTTGTTSASKGVCQSHYNITVNCIALQKHHKLDSNQRLLCTLPLFYANGLEFTIFAAMISGASIVLQKEFNPLDYLRVIEKYQISIASAVPSLFNALPDRKYLGDLSKLHYFVSAAAPLSTVTAIKIWKICKKQIIQGYGLTETTNFSTITPIDLSIKQYHRLYLESAIPPVGIEVFGNEVAVLSEDGECVQDGEIGEVCMRGHSIMMGYWNNPSDTTEAFLYGWFHSGDLGYFSSRDESGARFLTLIGRRKNIIKSGGQAISLDEIDRLLLKIPFIIDGAAISKPHPLLGEIYIVLLVSSMQENDPESIRRYLLRWLAPDKLPNDYIFIDHLPRSKNGKLNRSELRKLFLDEKN